MYNCTLTQDVCLYRVAITENTVHDVDGRYNKKLEYNSSNPIEGSGKLHAVGEKHYERGLSTLDVIRKRYRSENGP